MREKITGTFIGVLCSIIFLLLNKFGFNIIASIILAIILSFIILFIGILLKKYLGNK
ncbi:hypothetical protein [Clostridium sp.]|uniref:hypothetical protein n=1 Tax=Clostridium sp. TaxID=1506 RepID=UPI003F2A114B